MNRLYLKYLFKVNDSGKFVFFNYDDFEKRIAQFPGREGEIIFRDRTTEPSDKQVWYYQKIVETVSDDTGSSPGEIDNYFQEQHLPRIRKNIGGKIRETRQTLEGLDMKGFSNFITKVKEELITKWDIPEKRLDSRKIFD